ncbi:adenosine deaminase [Pseudolactococcus reticulitermitis]|uniref:adenosine deaminase n=1 Tax=Pseudolactococcus reticulitermitis TaxID=2025039 RepID=A0A224WXG9_9LACT|nr:adenosine deaminase [Lactococcus reticulitermitis]GAX46917.1 adenosine deaminase [Lactococcus reticulitermitis]
MRITRLEIEQLPKVELHCHLDGSIAMPTIRRLAQQAGIELPVSDDDLRQKITAPQDADNLLAYLAPFDFVLPMLQTEAALELAAYDILEQAQKDNIRYMEIRFAPTLHTAGGLTLPQIVAAVTRGLVAGERDFQVKANALLCGMRHESVDSILTVVELFADGGLTHLAGFDLAGVEVDGFPEHFAPVLEKVRSEQIPLTLHAGECGCAQNVLGAIKAGASRIGHGVALKDIPESWPDLAANKITIEMAPTSNFQTKAVDTLANYPFKKLFDAGVRVTINTDNRTVSDTTLNDEYEKIADWYDLSETDFRQITRYAFEASFMSQEQRELLAKEF